MAKELINDKIKSCFNVLKLKQMFKKYSYLNQRSLLIEIEVELYRFKDNNSNASNFMLRLQCIRDLST